MFIHPAILVLKSVRSCWIRFLLTGSSLFCMAPALAAEGVFWVPDLYFLKEATGHATIWEEFQVAV